MDDAPAESATLIVNLHGGTLPLPEHYATGRLVYLNRAGREMLGWPAEHLPSLDDLLGVRLPGLRRGDGLVDRSEGPQVRDGLHRWDRARRPDAGRGPWTVLPKALKPWKTSLIVRSCAEGSLK